MFPQLQMHVITTYAKAASGKWVTIAFLGMLFNIGGNVGSSIWLSIWSNDALLPADEANELTDLRIGIYALLGSVQGVLCFSYLCRTAKVMLSHRWIFMRVSVYWVRHGARNYSGTFWGRLFHWLDCFTLLKLGTVEVCALGVLLDIWRYYDGHNLSDVAAA